MRLAQLALERGKQAREVVLHHIVAGAGLHRRHRRLFVDRRRHEDERQLGAVPPYDLQGREPAEGRHLVIADDAIPARLREGRLQIRRRIDPPEFERGILALELIDEQQGVVLGVFDQEHAQRPESQSACLKAQA